MNDIEARLGELVREGMGKRSIAMIQDIKNTISIMGKPEDFGAEPISEAASSTKKSAHTEGGKSSGIKTGKQLFRDTEHKVIGGVCSGIAAYLGISDPLWVRLAFAALLFLAGGSFWLYIILMMIVPEAKTTADRLAMRGEPIDVNSIANAVESGAKNFADKFNEFGQPEGQAKFNAQAKGFFTEFGNFIGQILRGLGGFGKFIVGAISVIMIICVIAALVSFALGVGWAYPFFGYLSTNSWLAPLATFNVFWIIAVPAVSLIWLVRRLLFGSRVNPTVQTVAWIIFTANIFCLASIAGKVARNFDANVRTQQVTTLENRAEILVLNTLFEESSDAFEANLGDMRLHNQHLSKTVRCHIDKSDSDKFELVRYNWSNGESENEARTLLSKIDYSVDYQDGTLTVPAAFKIPKDNLFRGQYIKLTLKVPVGKKVKFMKEKRTPIQSLAI
ncbi:MAG: PspC domain-containing protein [Saprospiraceae bacterium]|nr:PspC domain-containing protein [Saprospiraceae bacterium]